MARRTKSSLLPLEMPQPFRAAPASVTTREELVALLTLMDSLHTATDPENGAFVAHPFAEELAACEPNAPSILDDFGPAAAVGFAAHRITHSDPRFESGADEIHPLVAQLLTWASMEQAAAAPERHGPWITHATHLGFVVAKRGTGVLRAALAQLAAWREQCPTMTHSAYFDQRLVLDIGARADGNIVARNYLPVRPVGIEYAHDTLLFQTACDDFAEQRTGHRVHGTIKLRQIFRFAWKTLE